MRAALSLVLLVPALALGACGGDDKSAPDSVGTSPAAPARTAPVEQPRPRIAIGVTEFNASLLRPAGGKDAAPAPGFAPYQRRVSALRPRYLRLVVDWYRVGENPSGTPDLAIPQDGCVRGQAPCAPFAGVRAQLEAVREQQRAHGGWEVVVTIAWTPEWAARRPGGCERPGTTPRSRPITAKGLAAYRRLIRELIALGKETGVELKWWSPFNEPNHPAFVSPQRERCDVKSPALSPAVYTRLVRAAQDELDAAGGDRRLVLGELAGVRRPSRNGSGVTEFVTALPDDVACSGAVWAQHQYVRGDGKGHDAVAEMQRALDRRDCTKDKQVWVTETGVVVRKGSVPADGLRDCRAMHAQLARWAADRGVGAAFQYTLREDPFYRVGLFDPGLTRSYPIYDTWEAWAEATRGEPDPAVPARCRAG
jgi:hypothetical protein